MASPSVDIATGITIAFGTSGFGGEIVDVNGPSLSRESIDTTHQGTSTARTFSPADFYDAGELTYTVHFNPDTLPPVAEVAETITLTWPAGATWVFTGFMTAFANTGTLDDKMTADVTVKGSGTVVPSAAP